MTRAVFFDVDFTLIYPGPRFRGEGYRAFCERHGMEVDESMFDAAVANAAALLDGPEDERSGHVDRALERDLRHTAPGGAEPALAMGHSSIVSPELSSAPVNWKICTPAGT